jgi:hypothetical protein
MARQTINVGTGPNSLDGDVIRNAFIKVNENFVDLYLYNQAVPITIYELTSEMLVNGSHSGITAAYDPINQTINLSGFSGDYNDLTNLPRIDLEGGSPSDVYLANEGFDGGSTSSIFTNNLDGGGVQ